MAEKQPLEVRAKSELKLTDDRINLTYTWLKGTPLQEVLKVLIRIFAIQLGDKNAVAGAVNGWLEDVELNES